MAEATSFEEFFKAHRRGLVGALRLAIRCPQDAEEIAQDAFLRVWERWDRVSTLDCPVGFLFRTAMNLLRNRARHASMAPWDGFASLAPTDGLTAVEDRDELVRLLRDLPPHQRGALILTAYLGCSSREAAAVLGIKASTVQALATQARARVRASGAGP